MPNKTGIFFLGIYIYRHVQRAFDISEKDMRRVRPTAFQIGPRWRQTRAKFPTPSLAPPRAKLCKYFYCQ